MKAEGRIVDDEVPVVAEELEPHAGGPGLRVQRAGYPVVTPIRLDRPRAAIVRDDPPPLHIHN